MPYYFKPNKKTKCPPYKTLSPPHESHQTDFLTLIPYLIALQIPVSFKIMTPTQAFIPSTTIQTFEHNQIILSTQIKLDINQIAAIILSFTNKKSLQQYLSALISYLNLARYPSHVLKSTFEYLESINNKITSIFYEDHEVFTNHYPKTIHRGGRTTLILSYEESQQFHLAFMSLNHVTSYKTYI